MTGEVVGENGDEAPEADAVGSKIAEKTAATPSTSSTSVQAQHDEVLTSEQLSKVFAHIAEGKPSLSREVFLELFVVRYKVNLEVDMTDGRSVTDSKPIATLEANEVVELISGPVKDDSSGVMRIQSKKMVGGEVGWVTVRGAGKEGSVFLSEGGSLFKIVKHTILTNSFELDDGNTTRKLVDKTRKLKEGEVLHVLEWPRKEEQTGLFRMKVRVRTDNAVGWLTAKGNVGTLFAVPI